MASRRSLAGRDPPPYVLPPAVPLAPLERGPRGEYRPQRASWAGQRGSADAGSGEGGGPRSPAFLQKLQEIQKREREKGQEVRREREKEGGGGGGGGRRERAERGRVQDDSAVFRQSRSSQLQAVRMKPRQRRGESFNVGKSPSGASAAPQQPVSSSRPFVGGSQQQHFHQHHQQLRQQQQHHQQQYHHQRSASQQHQHPQQQQHQQHAPWRDRGLPQQQRQSEHGRGGLAPPSSSHRPPQLSAARSSPSLNLAAPEDPAAPHRAPPSSPSSLHPPGLPGPSGISPAKSSPNLAAGGEGASAGERDRQQFAQVHGKRPAMYEQPLSGRTVGYPSHHHPQRPGPPGGAWDSSSSTASPVSPDKASSVGSGHSSGLSNKSYDGGGSQLSVSSSKSGASFDGASSSHKSAASFDAGSHVSGSSSRSGSSSYGRRYSENFGGVGGGSGGVGVGGVGGGVGSMQGGVGDGGFLGMDSRRSKPERRSLPPHLLHKYQADYANVGGSLGGSGSLHSEKISEIDDTDDEFDPEAPEVPPRPSPEVMGPPSSPPAPPVRDPSALMQNKINQAHEKYPSWPVTKPNGASEGTQPINTRAQSWTDHTNTNKDFPSKKGPPYAPGLRTLAERNSPSSERKTDDGKSRNSSDPGLKTEFVYDHYGRVRQKPAGDAGGKKPRFEEFYNSKPGYPPPKLDSDGHNFGDKEYSVPSPPERDVPPVDQRMLSNKLTPPDEPHSSSSPSLPPGSRSAAGEPGSKSEPASSDSSVKPGVVSHPGGGGGGGPGQVGGGRSRNVEAAAAAGPREKVYADSSTSPLEPKPSVFPITVSHDGPSQQTQMVRTQSKAYIVKQTPYYNTGTQTDLSPSYEAKKSGDKKCNAEVQVSDFAAQTSPKTPPAPAPQQPDPSSGGSGSERREAAQRPAHLGKLPSRSERSSGDYLNFPLKGPDGPQSQSSPKREKPPGAADPFGFHSRGGSGRDNQGPQSHSSPRYDRGSGSGECFSFPPPRGSTGDGSHPQSRGGGGGGSSSSSTSAARNSGGDYLHGMPPRKDSRGSEPQFSRESLLSKYATDDFPPGSPDLSGGTDDPSQSQPGEDISSIIRALSKEYYKGQLRYDPRRQPVSSHAETESNASLQGGMKEAESCSSVVIHPMENLGPFAQGGPGSGLGAPGSGGATATSTSADFGSRSSLSDSRLDVSSVVSESSSKGSSARGRYSMDPAQMARSRAAFQGEVRHAPSSSVPYAGPLSSGGTPHTEGPGGGERPRTLVSSKSMGSLRPHLLSPTESRSSGGSMNVTRESSPSGSSVAASSSKSDFHSRTGSDSVFVDDQRRGSDSGPQQQRQQQADSRAGRSVPATSIGRTASMKKAYGVYDDAEVAFVRQGQGAGSAASPTTEETRSPTLPPENNTLATGNYVQMNQIPRPTRYSEPKPLDQIQEEGDVFPPEAGDSRGGERRSSDRTPTSPDREGLPGASAAPFSKGAEARPGERHPSTENRGACGGGSSSTAEQTQQPAAGSQQEDMPPRRISERSASISSQDDIYHRPPLAAQEEHAGRRYSDWNAVRESWRTADSSSSSSRHNTSLKRTTSEQIMPVSSSGGLPRSLPAPPPPNSARLAAADRETRAAEAANRANASEEDLKRFQQMAVLNFMEMKTGQRMSSASVGSQDTIPSSPADSTATSNPYEQIGEHLAGGGGGTGTGTAAGGDGTSSVSDLISRTNEALAHRAQRTESFRRSGSSSSPSPRHGSFNEYMEMSRSGALVSASSTRKETEWSRLRTGLYPSDLQQPPGASPGIGSIPGPSQRSSLCSDHHYEDINLLHLSSQRSSLQEPLPGDGSYPAYRQLFGRELQAGLEQASGSGGMDSGLMAAHTYQNLRRPPPPPPPRSPSPERPPPALPPRMYRQQQQQQGGLGPPTSPSHQGLPPPHPGSSHPPTQPALPQRRPEQPRPQSPTPKPPASSSSVGESQVDDSKIDFKSLVSQWESNSPREDNYVDELRRKARQHLPNATTPMSMSILHSKPNINLTQSYKREPVLSQEATPPNSLSPEGSEKSGGALPPPPPHLEDKENKAPQRPPPPNMGGARVVDAEATSLKTVSPTPPARSPPPHQRPPPHAPSNHMDSHAPRRSEWGAGAEMGEEGGKPRSQSFDLLSQPPWNPPVPPPQQESSPRLAPRGSHPTLPGLEGKRRERAWSEHGGEGGRRFRHGSSSSSSNQGEEQRQQPPGAPLSRARTGSDAPLPSPPPCYGEEARGEEGDLPPPPSELPEFPDNSYGAAAFKGRGSRQVGTYQRSSSEAILRTAATYKIPASSSTEFAEQSRMGRSSWNSDSALVAGQQQQQQPTVPLPPRDSQTSGGAGGVPQDRSQARHGQHGSVQLQQQQDAGSPSGVHERLGGSGGFVAHGRSGSQQSSSSSSSGGDQMPRNVPAFKPEAQAIRGVRAVAQPLQRPGAGQRPGFHAKMAEPASSSSSSSNPVPIPARNGAVSASDKHHHHHHQQQQQEISGSVRNRIQTFEPSSSARVSSAAPHPSSSSSSSSSISDSSRVFSRHLGSAAGSGDAGSSRSRDGGDRHRLGPQDSQSAAGSAGSGSVGGVGSGGPQARVGAQPTLPERTRAPPSSGDRDRQGPGRQQEHPSDRDPRRPPPDDLSLPLRSPSGSEAGSSSGGPRRETRDTQSLPSTPGSSSLEDSGRLSSGGHSREPSQEELECDKQARQLARELETSDSKLSAVLTRQEPARMQFMDGLFSTQSDDSDQQHRRPPASSPSSQLTTSSRSGGSGRGAGESSPGPDRQEDKDNKTVMPPSYFKSSPKALVEIEVRRNESSYREEIRDNDSLMRQKEELMDKLKKKLVVLEESRDQLSQEISENEKLGNQIWEMVQKKCKTEAEKQKYKSYVADLEKIVCLLLNLAGQLARAENAVQSLAPDADQKLRKMTLDKREKLSTKHEDAKLLKQDIDKRSEQVAMLLRSRLTEEEFADYSYFVKMKSKLTIEFQELKDKITLGQEQMEELRRSIPTQHS